MTSPRPDTAQLRAAADAATDGPWEVEPDDDKGFDVWRVGGSYVAVGGLGGAIEDRADAEFIAAANPQAVRALCDEMDELRDAAEGSFPATWAGLIGFLDRQYPGGVFAGSTDPGPQIVALTRIVAELQAERDELRRQVEAGRELADEWKADWRHAGHVSDVQIGTDSAARQLRAALSSSPAPEEEGQ